jgi:hypothetical protein
MIKSSLKELLVDIAAHLIVSQLFAMMWADGGVTPSTVDIATDSRASHASPVARR